MPAVSVIIPMYNVRPYIEDCLLSLKRQTFGDFEALCVDDGSTDGTLEAARKAGGDDARFSFLSQANAGQSAARNAGIARATGKYVVFLDSDDYYEDVLQMLFERAERRVGRPVLLGPHAVQMPRRGRATATIDDRGYRRRRNASSARFAELIRSACRRCSSFAGFLGRIRIRF
ncbi:MAG: glycosyltransferase family 2 protein [Eggerthella lenta]